MQVFPVIFTQAAPKPKLGRENRKKGCDARWLDFVGRKVVHLVMLEYVGMSDHSRADVGRGQANATLRNHALTCSRH